MSPLAATNPDVSPVQLANSDTVIGGRQYRVLNLILLVSRQSLSTISLVWRQCTGHGIS